MGEIAEMIFEGTICERCGVWLHEGEEGLGFPRLCEHCLAKNDPPDRELQPEVLQHQRRSSNPANSSHRRQFASRAALQASRSSPKPRS